jgi:hypothetical protein
MLVDDTRANIVALSFVFSKLEEKYELTMTKCSCGESAV